MATVNYDGANFPRTRSLAWADIATGDTLVAYEVANQEALVGSVQFAGTFGGATVVLQISNDGTNYATAKDVNGDAISATAAAMFELSTAARYLRPGISGGTGDAVDVTLTLRG